MYSSTACCTIVCTSVGSLIIFPFFSSARNSQAEPDAQQVPGRRNRLPYQPQRLWQGRRFRLPFGSGQILFQPVKESISSAILFLIACRESQRYFNATRF